MMDNPVGVAFDAAQNLYVADTNNNRVLVFPRGSTRAERVYGQGGSFTSNFANLGGVTAASLSYPSAVVVRILTRRLQDHHP
jgi:DNA-binding beta-propeller fold protein YncE